MTNPSAKSYEATQVKDREQQVLSQAVSEAIAKSLAEVDNLKRRVDEALQEIEAVAERARNRTSSNISAIDIINNFQSELDATRNEAKDLFDRQREVLSSVNIAMFGRTGAGKSSLIEALSRGDGATISTGESDYTTEVRSVIWKDCKFIDTPGTNGWGRSSNRDSLENLARKSVEVADIVLLCFDTQSQQKGEFEKISVWVKEYGKPVIAILNVRNQQWRRSKDVHLGSQRRRLSHAVREHATNIDTELSALGIFGAPIIALSAQRAAYARASTPYRGPSPDQFSKLHKDFGSEVLLQWSNFEVFESVIIDVLSNHALELRLGMLYEQVRTLFERLSRVLKKVSSDAREAAIVLDKAIEGLLAVVGYPAQNSSTRSALSDNSQTEDLLSWVERVRGGPYEAKAQGKLGRFVKQRLEAEIGSLRARSLSLAEEAIVSAFEQRRDLEPNEFSQKVYDKSRIEKACEQVVKESEEFIKRETNLVIEDTRLDINFYLDEETSVIGSTGKTRRIVGYVSGAGGVLSGVASTLMGLALLDPEPASKVALAVGALVTGIASMVLGWFGSKQRKKAEEARQKAWSNAIASARRQVNEVYDGFAQQVSTTASTIAANATVNLLKDPLVRAGALWTLVAEGSLSNDAVREMKKTLPCQADYQGLLRTSAQKVSKTIFPNEEGSSSLALLGESWVKDPNGLVSDEGDSTPLRTRAYEPSLFQKLFDGLRAFITSFGGSIPQDSGVHWLGQIEQTLQADTEAAQALTELRAIYKKGLVRLQVFGDYSCGKTSFIKRLLIDGGLQIPNTLTIRANPTTDQIHTYEWEEILLVDVPGLQSTKGSHDDIAMGTYPDASIIVYLLQPNLLIGSTAGIELILKGDRNRGLAPKLERTLFVIHRSDELGVDPEVVPKEYVLLCDRKQKELQQALESRGIDISRDRIFCMAADPYQLVGDRCDVSSNQFDRFRSWDGFTEFRRAIREINAKFGKTALDLSLIEGGLARLGKLNTEAASSIDKLLTREQALARLNLIMAEIVAEGNRIEGELRAKAKRMVDDNAFGSLERVIGAANDSELEATAKQLADWWKIPAFETEVEDWQKEAKQNIDEWFARSADMLERTINAPRFKAAMADSSGGFDPAQFSGPKQGWLGRVISLVAQPLKGATRDVVYWVGKSLGATFRPWGAVNLAKTLGGIGVALGAVAVIFDVINMVRSWKGEKRRDELRKKLRGFVEDTANQVLQSLTDGNDEIAGPITYLSTSVHKFGNVFC